jgi:hypothetical protein
MRATRRADGRDGGIVAARQDQERPGQTTAARTCSNSGHNASHIEITRNGQTVVFERVKREPKGKPDTWHRASPNAADVDREFDGLCDESRTCAPKVRRVRIRHRPRSPALTITVKFDDSKKKKKSPSGQSGQDVYAARPGEPGAAKTDGADFNESLKSLDELSK